MVKIFKIGSSLMIAIGVFFLYLHAQSQGGSNLDILSQPSYYIIQNYWYVFLAGIVVVVFSLLGSFFSWFKKLDNLEEALPNAGYASDQDISTWVGGSTADLNDRTAILSEQHVENSQSKTEVLGSSEVDSSRTQVLSAAPSASDPDANKTEILAAPSEEGKL